MNDQESGERRRVVSDANLRSAVLTTPLLVAIVYIEGFPIDLALLAAGVPLGPVLGYVQNVLVADEGQRSLFMLGAVGAFVVAAVAGYLEPALWLTIGINVGMFVVGFFEVRREVAALDVEELDGETGDGDSR